MITEDYVSFEIAKLLKELGFDRIELRNSPHYAYNMDGQFSGPSWDTKYVAPTLQMTMKWLREAYNLHIMVDCIGAENYIPTIQFTRNSKDIEIKSKISKIGGNGFDSHEQACEAAIKYCLEYLLKKNDEDKHMKKPFFIITNTKTGKCFRAERCCADLVGHAIAITPQNIDDTVVVVGKPCFNDVMTKKECIGDNEKLRIQVFDKDGVMQHEYFMYNVWVRSVDADVNEVVLSFDHMA